MILVNIQEAKKRLSELLLKVEQRQETIVICRNGVPIAQLSAWGKNRNPLKQNSKLKKVVFHKNPSSPLSEKEWPVSSGEEVRFF